MAEPSAGWQEQRPPRARALWHWVPTGLADLPRIRRELRGRIAGHAADDGPVVADIGRTEEAWLLTVCDQAVDAVQEGWYASDAGKHVWVVLP